MDLSEDCICWQSKDFNQVLSTCLSVVLETGHTPTIPFVGDEGMWLYKSERLTIEILESSRLPIGFVVRLPSILFYSKIYKFKTDDSYSVVSFFQVWRDIFLLA